MFYEIPEQFIREPVFIGPLGIAEDPVEGVRVGLFDPSEGGLERLADVDCDFSYILPMAIFGNLEAIVFGEECRFLVSVKLIECCLVLFVMDIGETLEEQERENIGLEVCRIDRSLEEPSGFPQVGFELGEGDLGGHTFQKTDRPHSRG